MMNESEPRRGGAHGVAALLALAATLLAGCASIGPESVNRDRLDYTATVAESWQRQMLLNLVKLRYGDTPMFLDVGQIVSGYQVQGTFSVAATNNNLQTPPGGISSSFGVGAAGQFIDRPTITYAPLSGEQFARQMLTPIPPAQILSLVQGGTPVDIAFRLTVQEINGIRNQPSGDVSAQAADSEFYQLLALLRRAQAAGGMTLRMQHQEKGTTTLIVLRQRDTQAPDPEALSVRRMLGLDPNASAFEVVYGSGASNDKQIAILTRSILQVLASVAQTVQVPEPHVAERRAGPNLPHEKGPDGPVRPLIQIFSSKERPKDAAVAVPYRSYWFWIDDRDMPSKRIFSSLLFAFAMADTGNKSPPPILTIPAQ